MKFQKRNKLINASIFGFTTLHDQPKAPYFSGDQIKPITFVSGKLLGTPGVP